MGDSSRRGGKVEKTGREEEIRGLGVRGGDYLQRRKHEGIYIDPFSLVSAQVVNRLICISDFPY